MPKHNKQPLNSWLSAYKDCNDKRFIRVGNSLLLSKDFQELGASARLLYFALAMESGGNPRTKFSASAAKKYGIAKTTFERSKKELIEKGFITQIIDEDLSQFKTGEYKFVNTWKLKPAPQNGTL